MSFPARYEGVCANCPEPIVVGQQVTYNSNNKIIHAPCPADDELDDPLPKAQKGEIICPRCFLIHPVGACAYDE